jgi:1-acyl-sn-glycerol-3-phosphate acyltransferase
MPDISLNPLLKKPPPEVTNKATNLFTRIFRLYRLAGFVAGCAAYVALSFSSLDAAQRLACIRRWSTQLLDILAVRISVVGTPPVAGTSLMIVANHISWLDVFAINSAHPSRFIAKSEVRSWPLLGWLCEETGTLFIHRARRHHTAHINQQVVAAFAQGDSFAIFPEGTTTAGDTLLPFHASLLEPALAGNASVYPVAIHYTRPDGSPCPEADYTGDKSLLGSMWLMVSQREIHGQLQFLPPVVSANRHRREVARAAESAIASALNLAVTHTRAETAADPPAAAP